MEETDCAAVLNYCYVSFDFSVSLKLRKKRALSPVTTLSCQLSLPRDSQRRIRTLQQYNNRLKEQRSGLDPSGTRRERPQDAIVVTTFYTRNPIGYAVQQALVYLRRNCYSIEH